MTKKELTLEQRRLDTDLWIIAIATFIIYGIIMRFNNQLMSVIRDSNASIYLRLLVSAAFQFGIAGLGITVVCILRRERFTTYGLKIKSIIPTILLSVLCFIPNFLFMLLTGQIKSYAPLSIMITEDILAGGPFLTVFGMLVIAIVWGFFEGFNYVVISDKINKRYPTKNKWLDLGALTCALVCILFHPINFSLLGLLEIATTFVLIYGMLLVKRHTNNAWGCIFIFLFLWNAF
jgi:hypothetical protein